MKSKAITFYLSIFLPGGDRIYLGKYGTAFLKIITVFGVGIWWAYDIYLVASGKQTDSKGNKLL